MKHLYLILLFFITTIAFSQQKTNPGEIEGLTIYPNPVTNGKVFIKTKENSPKKIMIFDVFGGNLLETTILGSELHLGNLDAGVYMIRIFEKDKVATRKLIIK
ncbi:T9SS type A sorting domain-containing protein [Flavobacteriaceae bacterium KMM 6897]|nr:T9SS type A sorting domain-containing protein [Flavobacteriaceae bacterium KMM 6897]MEB8345916.1 T9SS type A sorting domain-containing protein [Flavobacteriaceae bacterium KMM 6898]